MFQENSFQCTTLNNGVCDTERKHYRFVQICNDSVFSGHRWCRLTKSWKPRPGRHATKIVMAVLVWTSKSKKTALNFILKWSQQYMQEIITKNWSRKPQIWTDRSLNSVLIGALRKCNTHVPARNEFKKK